MTVQSMSWMEALSSPVVDALTSSRPKDRIALIRGVWLPLIEHERTSNDGVEPVMPEAVLKHLLELLELTISRYHDSASRRAVIDFLRALHISFHNVNEACEKQFLGLFSSWLAKETDRLCALKVKPATPPTSGAADLAISMSSSASAGSRFTVYVWSTVTLATLFHHESGVPSLLLKELRSIIISQAHLLESILKDPYAKDSMKKTSIKEIRYLYKNCPSCLKHFVDVVAETTQDFMVPAIGHVLSEAIVSGNKDVDSIKETCLKYFQQAVISSRGVTFQYQIDSFAPVIQTLGESEVLNLIFVGLDKLILRSPESVLRSAHLCAKHFSIETSSILTTLSDSVLNQFRSTNDMIRQDALILWSELIRKCRPENVPPYFEKALKVFKDKSPSVETRAFAARAMAVCVIGDTETVKKSEQELPALLAKESSDLVIKELLDVYLSCNGLTEKPLMQCLASGLTSGKETIRIIYLKAIIQMKSSTIELLSTSVSQIVSLVEKNIPKATSSSGTASIELFVSLHLISSLGEKYESIRANVIQICEKSLVSKKPSPLSEKTMSKNSPEDLMEILRLCHQLLLEYGATISLDLFQSCFKALLWICINCSDHNCRRAGLKTLQSVSQMEYLGTNASLADTISSTLWELLDEMESTFSVQGSIVSEPISLRLRAVFINLTYLPPVSASGIIEKRLLSLFLLAYHPFVNPSEDLLFWPGLVNRIDSEGRLDPADILAPNISETLSIILGESGLKSSSPCRQKAALLSISTAVFLTSQASFPHLILFLKQMDPKNLKDLSFTDVAIWKADPSVPFHDVLKKKSAETDKNRKDYKTEKWERELRAELERKRGSQRDTSAAKLTKEETALVKGQLQKESEIRSKVNALYEQFTTGISVLKAMVHGNRKAIHEELPTFTNIVMPLCRVTNQLGGIDAIQAGWDVGMKSVECLEALAQCCSVRVQSFIVPLLHAYLRHENISEIPNKWKQEPWIEQASRLVFELRDSTKSEMDSTVPLPIQTFVFCYPLIDALGKYCISTQNETQNIFELLEAIVDIIALHIPIGTTEGFPRVEILSLFLAMIQHVPKMAKTVQAHFVQLCCVIGEVIEDEEIMLLIQGLSSPETQIRNTCLQGLEYIEITEKTAAKYATWVWIMKHDEHESNRNIAAQLWSDNEIEIGPNYSENLMEMIVHETDNVRCSAARATASAIQRHTDTDAQLLERIISEYNVQVEPPKPKYDAYGMVIPESLEVPDNWKARCGLADAIKESATSLGHVSAEVFHFLIQDPGALGDNSELVRKAMLNAGLALVEQHGSSLLETLIPIFNEYLESPALSSERHDRIRESVIILLGATAKNLDASDVRVGSIIELLVETLKTPSEPIQIAVSECLPPLIKFVKDTAPQLIERLLSMTCAGENYGIRRGGAYGLAGVVKGRGIAALKECGVIDYLKNAIEDKKKMESRQGALFAFEMLSQTLGRLFEPYIMNILPLLLNTFGDSSADVREATQDASRVIMRNLSAHCVKLILPSVLNGLDDNKWRTQVGSVELLGTMAYLAPKQLSISLPIILPRLTAVLNDSHMNVQKAAKAALEQFSDVIQNPEIKHLVPKLLNGLADPTKYTSDALTALIQTSFAHYIDSPSLALVVPIVERGLKERGTETKKKAAHIIGSMVSLTEQKDLSPYLTSLVPLLREVLVDPVPEARSVAASALGHLVERLGEENFPTLLAELIQTLKSDTSGVDREGSAQGIAEVLFGLGLSKMEELLPEILANVSSSKPYVREGFMLLLIYIPATFGDQFQPYISGTIPCILKGLADEFEFVRSASLKAGQIVVNRFAKTAVELLLPELENGLFDENWRIRQSSIQLLGDLLYKIAGISGRTQLDTLDDDETLGTEHGKRAIVQVLGEEKFVQVLASLYVVRSDVNAIVRQASIHVWKSIVSNTPRTLKEIVPAMMDIIINCLSCENYEKQQVAANTLGDLVHKLGEFIMSQVVPLLREKLESQNDHIRLGACTGLAQIMTTAGKQHIETHSEDLTVTIRKALVDPSAGVRESAAKAFDMLLSGVGNKAVDDVIPSLLIHLKQHEETHGVNSTNPALEALKEIMVVRGNVVFPVLLPTLLSRPITRFHAQALGSLISVAGAVINRKMTFVLESLMDSLNQNDDAVPFIQDALKTLLQSIDSVEATHSFMSFMHENCKKDVSTDRRKSAFQTLSLFCDNNQKANINIFIADWIKILVANLDVDCACTQETMIAAWNALNSLIKTIKKDDLCNYVNIVRRAIISLVTDMHATHRKSAHIDGFSLPKGISPVLSIYLQGLLYGGTETRELSAQGIGELIQHTSSDGLKAFVLQLAGPLIRIVGEKFNWKVRSYILHDLELLLAKCAPVMKPFMPQLQRTFVKCLTDNEEEVRLQAASALGVFISNSLQIDSLVRELEKSLQEETAEVAREALIVALWQVFRKFPGKSLSETSIKLAQKCVFESNFWIDSKDNLRKIAALCVGAWLVRSTDSIIRPMLQNIIRTATSSTSNSAKHGALLVFESILSYDPNILANDFLNDVLTVSFSSMADPQPQIQDTALMVICRSCLVDKVFKDPARMKEIVALLTSLIKDSQKTSDQKRLTLTLIQQLDRKNRGLFQPYLQELIPSILFSLRDRIIPVKLAGEEALIRLLKLLEGDETLQAAIKSLQPTESKQLADYHKRVLSKLVEQQRQRKILEGLEDVDNDADSELLEPMKVLTKRTI